jgi:hypothetical protein
MGKVELSGRGRLHLAMADSWNGGAAARAYCRIPAGASPSSDPQIHNSRMTS